jgi:hypothetical protein
MQTSNPEGWLYVAETFLASLMVTKTSKNPLFEVISLRSPTGPLPYQFFFEGFYRHISIDMMAFDFVSLGELKVQSEKLKDKIC